MTYRLITPKPFQKQFELLPAEVKKKVAEKILYLSEFPRPSGVCKLKGFENEYRIRVGDYRIRYQINDEKQDLTLLHCRHRREVYRS